jgi:hypothetical protein
MPYIIPERRVRLDLVPDTWQELSYQIDYLILTFLRGRKTDSQAIGEVWAAIAGAKKAFNDEIASVYEAKKRNENGPIFHEIRASL